MALIDIDLRPGETALRIFGWAAFGVFGLLGGLIWWLGGLPVWSFPEAAPLVALVLAAIGLLAGLFSLLAPRANRPLYVGLILVTYPIGFVVSFVTLALLFYAMILPLGLLFRLVGRDPLERTLDPDAVSYWLPHPGIAPAKRYFQQF